MKRLRRELDAARMKSACACGGRGERGRGEGSEAAGAARGWAGARADARPGGPDARQAGQRVVVLGAVSEGKVTLICGVTKDLTGKVQAGKIVGLLAAMVGGKGGGRPDLAEAGGSDVGALDGALAKAAEVVGGLLG